MLKVMDQRHNAEVFFTKKQEKVFAKNSQIFHKLQILQKEKFLIFFCLQVLCTGVATGIQGVVPPLTAACAPPVCFTQNTVSGTSRNGRDTEAKSLTSFVVDSWEIRTTSTGS